MKIIYTFLLSFFLVVPVFASEKTLVVAENNGDDIEATMSFQLGDPEGKATDSKAEDEDYLEEEEGVYSNVQDPFEGYNRTMFQFNNALYNGLFEPIATGYAAVLPYDFRVAVSNLFDNLAMPMHFTSSFIQGDEEKTLRVLKRFAINTTLGMFGMGDVAAENFDLPKVYEDMEQALTKNSTNPGPYIEWPIIGPSTAAGTVGKVLDAFLNPAFWLVGDFWTGAAITGEKMTNELSFTPDIRRKVQEGAVDPYLAVQDTYLQYRQNQLKK
jgi:phospholipid-binding lipoprotein MlaA